MCMSGQLQPVSSWPIERICIASFLKDCCCCPFAAIMMYGIARYFTGSSTDIISLTHEWSRKV